MRSRSRSTSGSLHSSTSICRRGMRRSWLTCYWKSSVTLDIPRFVKPRTYFATSTDAFRLCPILLRFSSQAIYRSGTGKMIEARFWVFCLTSQYDLSRVSSWALLLPSRSLSVYSNWKHLQIPDPDFGTSILLTHRRHSIFAPQQPRICYLG